MYILTMFLISLLMKSMQNKLNRFVNSFMLLNFAKLFLYTVIIFVYAWLNRQGAVAFIMTFFTYYILITAYEIIYLLKIDK
jgi:nucleoside recognition membrane protein YjiH